MVVNGVRNGADHQGGGNFYRGSGQRRPAHHAATIRLWRRRESIPPPMESRFLPAPPTIRSTSIWAPHSIRSTCASGAFPSGIPGVLTPAQDADDTQNYAPDNVSGYNVNVIAIEVPITMLTSTGAVGTSHQHRGYHRRLGRPLRGRPPPSAIRQARCSTRDLTNRYSAWATR